MATVIDPCSQRAATLAVQEQFGLAQGPAGKPQSPLASSFSDDGNSLLPASSIPSPLHSLSIQNLKGKGRGDGERQPGPVTAAIDARDQKANAVSIQTSEEEVHARPATFASIFDPSSPPSTPLSQSDSPPVGLGAGYRKRRLEYITESDDGEESRTLKRLCRPSTPGSQADLDVISLFTDEEDDCVIVDDDVVSMSSFIVDDDDSMLSSPPPAVQAIRRRIQGAIQQLRNDPFAKEKSRAQMDALIAVMTEPSDLVITMKTGGGKSMLWMVPHILEQDAKSIVVCPFVALLDEQYRNTTAFGLRCHKFGGQNATVPDDVQVLFMQVEHCASQKFTT